MNSVCTLLLITVVINCVTADPPARRLFTFTKCECSFDNDSVTALSCRMKPARNVFGVLTFIMTLKRPVNKLLVDIQSYRKGSSNVYSKGGVHIVANLCEVDLSERNLALKFLAPLRDLYILVVKKCPYKGDFGMINYTIPSLDTMTFIPFMPTAEYKVRFQFFDVELNKTIVDLAISAYYRGKSMSFG